MYKLMYACMFVYRGSYHVSAGEIFSSIQEESDSAMMAPSGSKV